MKLKQIKFSAPTPAEPYYHAVVMVLDITGDTIVRGLLCNDIRNLDFTVYNDDMPALPAVFRKNTDNHTLNIRLNWRKEDIFLIELELLDENGQNITLHTLLEAKEENGYWNKNWKYYASHVLTETSGYNRVQEPVHVVLSMYEDRLLDTCRELRVVEINPDSGAAREIPSQVYSASARKKWNEIMHQPSTTVQVAFMADVPANSRKVYLFFYGNPHAKAPCYPSDLTVSGEGYELCIENIFYTVHLHKDSGSINEIIPKNRPELTYRHQLETNGTLQWNPGIYTPQKTWMHVSDRVWTEDFTVITGPVFIMVKLFNPIADYEEADYSLTYLFYSNTAGITVKGNIDINKDLDVAALRNGSVVLNKETTGDFAWKDVDHTIKNVHITDLPRHPVKAMVFDAKTPWFAFYNRIRGNGLGVLNLEFTGLRRSGGLVGWEPYYYLHWGPWFDVSRSIIYTFTSSNHQRVVHMAAGTSFYEQYVLIPFEAGKGEDEYDRFDALEYAYKLASEPLSKIAVKYDTDSQTPDVCVPPILPVPPVAAFLY